ncbi:hypothetical protein MF406_06240 [Georgenia sp. TF02-10]|uniref:hypothetical protein n=1 Tax=Georgenia sp. TF02-10 TaxID=2917725 RepID=UPI001FA7E4FF|nr:hypothetical protein [Georgenia sp. TF02-10]UNX55831.1 hypothetical protein MF406_06240 [Georgenia sp. TF02-10]
MTAEDRAQLRRLRRPTWRDPRLGIGVLLVAGSVALGTWAVRDAAGTVQVYATRDAVTPGDAIDGEDLTVQDVRLGGPQDRYLRVADGLPDAAVALRALGPGELLPRSALGEATAVDLRPVVVPLGAAVPADVGPGTTVDLWLTPPPPTGGPQDPQAPEPVPEMLAADLLVADIVREESMLAGGTGVSAELLVPAEDLPGVLAALPAEGQLVIVPTFGAGVPAAATGAGS